MQPSAQASPATGAYAHEKALPIVGILAVADCPTDVETSLSGLLGPAIERGGPWDFDATDYYAPEMGRTLRRSFLAFPPHVPDLVAWKLATGEIERARRAPDGGRRINLDPGYVSLGGLFLASTKPAPHRIHLARGIHAEITLFYGRGAWQRLPWTFPDFRSGRYDAFLSACRERLKRALRCGGPDAS